MKASLAPGLHVAPGQAANALAYDGWVGRWSRLFVPMVITAAEVAPGCRVLDISTGTGEAALMTLHPPNRWSTIQSGGPGPRRQRRASSAGRARITGAIGVHRPGDDVAIAGPRGGKAWPRLFLGRRSMPSRYVLTSPFPGTLAGYFLAWPELLRLQ